MKSVWKRAIATLVLMALVLTGPSVSLAASSVSSLDELAREVNRRGVNRETSFSIKYKGDYEDLITLMDGYSDFDFFYSRMLIQDDPSTSDDADYLVGNIDFTKNTDFTITDDFAIKFKLRYFEKPDQTAYVNSHVPQILKELGVDNMSNYEKVCAIHDYVCELITYDASDEDIVSTMYGALVNNRALCNSYALCMYKLLVEAGVPCKYIGGKAGTGRDSGGHAWNIVALGDKWYNLDATWNDDEEMGITYDYFLKGSADFDEADPSQAHKMDAPFCRAPFKTIFPIARNAFNPTMMSDVNEKITIGGTDPGDDSEVKYTFSDVVDGKWPKNGKISVKKNKTGELQLFIRKGMESLVKSATYKVTKGKANLKNIKNYGVLVDEGEYFTALTFKGKKKGAVRIKITLKLTNGQSVSYTFKGKIK